MKLKPLQKQDQTITEAPQIMTLPGKPARPLKKRRIVSIEPKEEAVDDTRSQSSQNDNRRKVGRKKEKRARTTISPLPSPRTSPATVIKKSVSWNDPGGNVVHVQPDPSQLYPYFNESDLWYTRNNYQDFLLDRLKTVESHRYLTANNITNDESNSDHCIRGLELFHDEKSNEHFKSKKKLYHSTIQMEQMRQAMLGIKNPERFRELVASQSDLALHRAQELAAQDARDAYSSRQHPASNPLTAGKPLKSLSSSSLSDMKRLNNLMESIYGNTAPRDTRNSSWNTINTANVSESGNSSVVSDSSSTGSADSSSSGNTCGQSLFADESIRKLQERSMRRLMGIYQNNNGDGAEGSSETNSLFKFARRDSLLGLRNNKPASTKTSNASSKNSTWAVPPQEKASSPQEQLLEMFHRRQLLQEHHEQQQQQQQQQQQEEDTSSLEEQIMEMLRQRQLLQEHLRHRLQQQQQQFTSAEETTPSLQAQLIETMKRRKMLEGHGHQEQQVVCSTMENDNGLHAVNTTRLIEEYLIQQQQHHEDHKNKMKMALIAMGSTRFSIRRDTLSHVHNGENHHEVGGATAINHQSLPWSLSGMA